MNTSSLLFRKSSDRCYNSGYWSKTIVGFRIPPPSSKIIFNGSRSSPRKSLFRLHHQFFSSLTFKHTPGFPQQHSSSSVILCEKNITWDQVQPLHLVLSKVSIKTASLESVMWRHPWQLLLLSKAWSSFPNSSTQSHQTGISASASLNFLFYPTAASENVFNFVLELTLSDLISDINVCLLIEFLKNWCKCTCIKFEI